MRALKIAALVIAGGLGLTGCPADKDEVDGGPTRTDGGSIRPDGGSAPGTDGGGVVVDGGFSGEIADFAKELILNHSTDLRPLNTEDQRFAPDTQDATKFPASFF